MRHAVVVGADFERAHALGIRERVGAAVVLHFAQVGVPVARV